MVRVGVCAVLSKRNETKFISDLSLSARL